MTGIAIGITGVDTDIGKTVIAAWIALHWRAHYWKPIQSGVDSYGQSDTARVRELADLPRDRVYQEAYRFIAPLSPHIAAAREGVSISLANIALPSRDCSASWQRLVVEGAGGVLVPLNDREFIVDLFACLKLPLLVVTHPRLGTINQTLTTIESLRRRHLSVKGVIMCGEKNRENRESIEKYGNVSVVAEFPKLEQVNRAALEEIPLPQQLRDVLGDC